MAEQSIQLCKKLGYYSAGTLEFLVDENKNFYFLEMNTRLQVEHPVTECITRLDLVHQMIRIAKGYRLNVKQDDVKINGWAIECRIYAEDPSQNFGLPNTGRIYKYNEPQVNNVRYDSGIEEGSDVSIYYDNLLCKLTGYGNSRHDAINNSLTALDSYVIRGVTHNIPLLRDVLSEKKFQSGAINTGYLYETYPNGFCGRKLNEVGKDYILATSCILFIKEELRLNNSASKKWDFIVAYLEENTKVCVEKLGQDYQVVIDDKKYVIQENYDFSQPIIEVQINEKNVIFQLISKTSHGKYKIS